MYLYLRKNTSGFRVILRRASILALNFESVSDEGWELKACSLSKERKGDFP